MSSDDETQQSPGARSTGTRRQPPAWMRWIAGATRQRTDPERHPGAASAAQLDVHTTLRLLPKLLDSSSLPNGVIELLIEDFEAPTRQLFDIHDGCVTLVEPGAAVPWASIAGSPTAWTLALGPEHNTAALHLTGDEQLARRVLSALPQSV